MLEELFVTGFSLTSSSMQRLTSADLELQQDKITQFNKDVTENLNDESYIIPKSPKNCFFLKDVDEPDDSPLPLDSGASILEADEVE